MKKLITTAALVLTLSPAAAMSAEKDKPAKEQPAPAAAQAEDSDRVNVDQIKQKYWARGEEAELGVVQNRLYSKAHKWELGAFWGLVSSDPFMSVKAVGGTFGYHFSEYFSVHALGFKHLVSDSDAMTKYKQVAGVGTNTNEPKNYGGLEAAWSVMYGKLSFIGKKIIYYDLHLLGGLGRTATETGNYFTQHVGIGQRFYLNQSMALRLDYRLMRYHEDIKEKAIPQIMGKVVDSRDNFNHAITLGLSFSFGGSSK